jgi:hypothetical protein
VAICYKGIRASRSWSKKMVQESMEKWELGLAKVTEAIISLEGKMTQRLDNLEAADERLNQRMDKTEAFCLKTERILSILMEERTELDERKRGEQHSKIRVSEGENWGKMRLGQKSFTKSQSNQWVILKMAPDREARRNGAEI